MNEVWTITEYDSSSCDLVAWIGIHNSEEAAKAFVQAEGGMYLEDDCEDEDTHIEWRPYSAVLANPNQGHIYGSIGDMEYVLTRHA